MTTLKNGGPAFPVYMVVGDVDPKRVVDAINAAGANGVTLRAYLMANATSHLTVDHTIKFSERLLGELAPTFGTTEYLEWLARADAKWRAMQADAMLAELAKVDGGGEAPVKPEDYNRAARALRQAQEGSDE